MNEATKAKRVWSDFERALLQGEGIDIGCGPDPVAPNAMAFDVAQGDANHITRHVRRQFDFVFSSHCLEHMRDPREAILEWWSLVKPGGVLFVLVPDEDLYEQGIFPSRFNPDHKSTFTLSKRKSWSPRSFNMLDLARSLPDGELLNLELQDEGYDRGLVRFGGRAALPVRAFRAFYWRVLKKAGLSAPWLEHLFKRIPPVDQTDLRGAQAQIQLIVRRKAAA